MSWRAWAMRISYVTYVVDPLIPNPNDRMTKLRCQQEVRHYAHFPPLLLSDPIHIASRNGLYPRPSGDQSATADTPACDRRMPGLACKECPSYAIGYAVFNFNALCYANIDFDAHSDIVDYVEPTMLIVGSRGIGNLKGYAFICPRPSCSQAHPDWQWFFAAYCLDQRRIISSR